MVRHLDSRPEGMTAAPHQLGRSALETAEEGLPVGELPIGAVVSMGSEIVGRAYTQEQTLGRRLFHADLLAMIEADQRLSRGKRAALLVLAVALEPCWMCLGAAMSLRVTQIWYGLASPSDGATGATTRWQPRQPGEEFARVPDIDGGILRQRCREQCKRSAVVAKARGFGGGRRISRLCPISTSSRLFPISAPGAGRGRRRRHGLTCHSQLPRRSDGR